jgi:hypothetical protein
MRNAPRLELNILDAIGNTLKCVSKSPSLPPQQLADGTVGLFGRNRQLPNRTFIRVTVSV